MVNVEILVVRACSLCWLPLAIALACGCSPSAPELTTWKVEGTVVDQTGSPVTGGVVRFTAIGEGENSDPHIITVGPIQPDGAFAVKTLRKGFTYEGAVAGEYRLAVMTDKRTSDGQQIPVVFEFPESHTIQTGENKLSLKIQR